MNVNNFIPKQQNQIKINLDDFDDISCIKCKCKQFTMMGSIKMISPIQSPSGKWDSAIKAAWVCKECSHPFNPKEWLDNQAKELHDEKIKRADA